MDDRPFLLSVRLGREDDVGVLEHGRGEEGCVRDHGACLAERLLPERRAGLVKQRVAVEQDHGAQLAGRERLADLLRIAANDWRVAKADRSVRQHTNLAQAARVRPGRNLQQAAAIAAVKPELLGKVEQRAGTLVAARAGR